MTREDHERFSRLAAGLVVALLISGALARGQTPQQPQQLPNMGQQITPLAPTGSALQFLNPGLAPPAQDWLASQAVTSVVSPDHKTMLVMTSGYNRYFTSNVQPATGGTAYYAPDSNEYVFVFDISTPTPVQNQVVQMPFAYSGIVFDPSNLAFHHRTVARAAYGGASPRSQEPRSGSDRSSQRRHRDKQRGGRVSLRRGHRHFKRRPDPGGCELL